MKKAEGLFSFIPVCTEKCLAFYYVFIGSWLILCVRFDWVRGCSDLGLSMRMLLKVVNVGLVKWVKLPQCGVREVHLASAESLNGTQREDGRILSMPDWLGWDIDIFLPLMLLILFYYRLLWDIEYSSLCYTIGTVVYFINSSVYLLILNSKFTLPPCAFLYCFLCLGSRVDSIWLVGLFLDQL